MQTNMTGDEKQPLNASQIREKALAISATEEQKFSHKKNGTSAKEAKSGHTENGNDHLTCARAVISAFGPGNLIEADNFTWAWDSSGVWRKMDLREIKQSVHRVAPCDNLTRGVVDSITDLVRTEIFVPRHRFDTGQRAINCLNGELSWNGSRWELEPHCREHYRTTQIPVAFDPGADAPTFRRFLSEIFEDDADRQAKAQIILEGVGYTLLASCEYEKFILLIGRGANGKSVLMDVIAALVGREQVAAVQPCQFENRFQRAHLHGKLANLVTEIAEGHEIADAQLKAIVSGELTTAEHKHRPPFDFTPFCTCWFGTNHMPHTRDFSDALFRRALILTFNRVFDEAEQDQKLKGKLRKELPGILNLSLQALAGVFERGTFTSAQSCDQAKREWRLNNDQCQQFIEERCELEPGAQTESSELYRLYLAWAETSGVRRTLNRNNFTSRLARLGVEPFKGRAGMRMLAGIRVNY